MPRFHTRGHAQALAAIERAVQRERPPHALLLVGPDRVGKTTLALDLAAGLLCLAEDALERPCRNCAACRKIDHSNHPDLHRLAPQGAGQQIRVGQVQALASELALLPLEGRFRVAIIEQAQRLNLDAQNALLKTLEEPPAAVAIVLAADESANLLPTVVSRCARLRLGSVAPEVIAGMLEEKGLADAVSGNRLARVSGGRPGVALAVAATPEAVIIQARLARTLLDLLAGDRRQRLSAQPVLLEDGAALALATADALDDDSEGGASGRPSRRQSPAERRAAAAQVLVVWRDVARDLALATHGARSELRLIDLLDELQSAGVRVKPAQVSVFVSRLDALSRALDSYANPDLALDVLLLEWPHVGQAA
jgi:DNA polymerase III delta' subunit